MDESDDGLPLTRGCVPGMGFRGTHTLGVKGVTYDTDARLSGELLRLE
jgi:hypothetical protein